MDIKNILFAFLLAATGSISAAAALKGNALSPESLKVVEAINDNNAGTCSSQVVSLAQKAFGYSHDASEAIKSDQDASQAMLSLQQKQVLVAACLIVCYGPDKFLKKYEELTTKLGGKVGNTMFWIHLRASLHGLALDKHRKKLSIPFSIEAQNELSHAARSLFQEYEKPIRKAAVKMRNRATRARLAARKR